MRKSSFNYSFFIIGSLTILLIFYSLYSKKEGFAGMTYILDDLGNRCLNKKEKVGVNGKGIDENKVFDGMTCPSGYILSYIGYGNEALSLKCTKQYLVCEDGYKYNKNATDNKYCQSITNKNDKKTTINNIVCPVPQNHEVRIIHNNWCVIGNKNIKPVCITGFTYDTNISKCYKCV